MWVLKPAMRGLAREERARDTTHSAARGQEKVARMRSAECGIRNGDSGVGESCLTREAHSVRVPNSAFRILVAAGKLPALLPSLHPIHLYRSFRPGLRSPARHGRRTGPG